MTDLHARLLAELDRRAAVAAAATEGPWAIWHDLDHQGFITVGNEAGVIPEGEVYVEGANPTAHVYVEEDAEHIALHDPADALRGYAEDRDVLRRHASSSEPVVTPFRALVVCVNCSDLGTDPVRVVGWPCWDVLSVARRLGVAP